MAEEEAERGRIYGEGICLKTLCMKNWLAGQKSLASGLKTTSSPDKRAFSKICKGDSVSILSSIMTLSCYRKLRKEKRKQKGKFITCGSSYQNRKKKKQIKKQKRNFHVPAN